MKKALSILLTISLLMLTGCSGKGVFETEPPTTEDPVVRITFPEGSTVSEVAALLENGGVCSAESFIAEAKSPSASYSFLDEIKNKNERPFIAEGYVFPDTYDFYKGESAATAISRFFDNYNSKITDEYKARANELGFTMDEILRIASVIQEEASEPEMKKVSSVLHNRLNSDYKKLECDVSVKYLNTYVAPYYDDISAFSELYNTYKCVGLPAGPITNPGITAIEAALYPDDTSYIFFISDKDGNYHYAESFSEHEKNVSAYVD